MCNGQYRDVFLHSANYVRSPARCRHAATFQSLEVTLVLSKLDYRNAVLVGLPVYLVRRLSRY